MSMSTEVSFSDLLLVWVLGTCVWALVLPAEAYPRIEPLRYVWAIIAAFMVWLMTAGADV